METLLLTYRPPKPLTCDECDEPGKVVDLYSRHRSCGKEHHKMGRMRDSRLLAAAGKVS